MLYPQRTLLFTLRRLIGAESSKTVYLGKKVRLMLSSQ